VPGMQELLVIMLVGLFVLGPERLPVVARAAGRLLTRVRNYGVTASKELRGAVDLGGLGSIEQEVSELRRELDRTRADLRRAMRETVATSDGATSAVRPDLAALDAPSPPDTSETTDAADAAGAPDVTDERA